MNFYSKVNYKDALKIANKKHDVVTLRVIDKTEQHIPEIGLIKLKDNETGEILWVDSSSKNFQKEFKVTQLKFDAELKDIFSRSGVDTTNIYTGESYIKPLMNLFKKR